MLATLLRAPNSRSGPRRVGFPPDTVPPLQKALDRSAVPSRQLEPSEPAAPRAPDRAIARPCLNRPAEMRSRCWCPPLSSIRLELRHSTRKADLTLHLTKLGVGVRRRDQLQSGPHRLRDSRAARALGLVQ